MLKRNQQKINCKQARSQPETMGVVSQQMWTFQWRTIGRAKRGRRMSEAPQARSTSVEVGAGGSPPPGRGSGCYPKKFFKFYIEIGAFRCLKNTVLELVEAAV